MMLINQFIPENTTEYEQCRIIVTNSTTRQLRHRLASFFSEIYIMVHNMVPIYESYIDNAGFLWSLVGKKQF